MCVGLSETEQQLIVSPVEFVDVPVNTTGSYHYRCLLHAADAPYGPVQSPISRGSEVKAADSHERRIARRSPRFLRQNRTRWRFIGALGYWPTRRDSHAVREPAVGWLPKRGLNREEGRGRKKERGKRLIADERIQRSGNHVSLRKSTELTMSDP